MKFTGNGRFRTSEDGRFVIIKDCRTNDYTIRDNEKHGVIMVECGGFTVPRTFNRLCDAKAYIETIA